MNKEDKNIFDFMNSLTEEEAMKLLQDVDFSDENMSSEQMNRMKRNITNNLKKPAARNKRKLGKGLIAASVAALLLLTGFTPQGQKAMAEIIKKLYFIPGVGKVQESDGKALYVLLKPAKFSYKGQEATVKSAVRDTKSLSINLLGNGYMAFEDFKTITIKDNSGNTHSNSFYLFSNSSDIWNGNLGFNNIPENMNTFDIIMPDKSTIHIVLSIPESYEDYNSMGPTDAKNNLGITLIPGKEDGKMKFNLIQHPMQNGKVDAYGHQVDLDHYGKLDITLKDDLGRQYDLETPKQYTSPLSEFYFVPTQDAKGYTVEIPEVTLNYKINKNIVIPVPKDGQLEVNKNFDINGFTLTVKRVVRTDNRIKVYVDTNYNSNKPENLSEIRIQAINSNRSMGYSWNVSRDTRTVEYLEFEVKSKDKSIDLKLSEFNTILKGPWRFEF